MRSAIVLVFLIISLPYSSEAYEAGINNSGFEIGINGKKHFKLLGVFDFFILGKGTVYKGLQVNLLVQWLNLRRDNFYLNFLTGPRLEYYSYDYQHYNKNLEKDIGYGFNVLDIEPEAKINEHISLFIRKSLLNFTITNELRVVAGTHVPGRGLLLGIVSTSKVGLRYTF